jgi:hypothetical protein
VISFTDFPMALPLLLNMRRRKIYLSRAKHCLVIDIQSQEMLVNETIPIFLTTGLLLGASNIYVSGVSSTLPQTSASNRHLMERLLNVNLEDYSIHRAALTYIEKLGRHANARRWPASCGLVH